MREIWRPVKGYAKIYEVSNLGRIRTAEGKTTHSEFHGERIWKQRVLKPKIDKNGYKRVSLWKNKVKRDCLVHRLVAESFLRHVDGKNLVNHKDGNPSNNHIDNIEWCTPKENVNHAFQNRLMTTQKPVVLVDKVTNKAHYFYSRASASVFLGKNKGFVSNVIINGEKEVDGFEIYIQPNKENVKEVDQYG